ncbi:MAG: zinc ribbon domain-containing protein [Actinobacteria bacterium]|nr:zinc ribbon domain-containing protein [Actinomycetota bacterium]
MSPQYVHMLSATRGAAVGILIGLILLALFAGEWQWWWSLVSIGVGIVGFLASRELNGVRQDIADTGNTWGIEGLSSTGPEAKPVPSHTATAGQRCWRCHAQLSGGEQFCTQCGVSLF